MRINTQLQVSEQMGENAQMLAGSLHHDLK